LATCPDLDVRGAENVHPWSGQLLPAIVLHREKRGVINFGVQPNHLSSRHKNKRTSVLGQLL
jgi:hypothetical protein